MVYNKQMYSDELDNGQPSNNHVQQAPMPSPRKSLEFLESQKDQYNQVFEVKTPIATPTQSPPRSPIPTVQHKPIVPPQQEPEKPQQPLQFYILNKSDDEYSILDVTIEEEEPQSIYQTIKLKLFILISI